MKSEIMTRHSDSSSVDQICSYQILTQNPHHWSPKSLRFIFLQPWRSVSDFTAIHPGGQKKKYFSKHLCKNELQRKRKNMHCMIKDQHTVYTSCLAFICDCEVNCPRISLLKGSKWLCRAAFSTHSIKYDQSRCSNILSRQEGWSFKMIGLRLIHSRWQNPVNWA